MKKLFLLFGAVAMLSSCTSYLLSTVSSSGSAQPDSTGTFNLENDSLRISYSFTGDNAPMHVDVYNKLNEPLYVNWQRSAVIVGDKSYSFVDDEVKITGETSSSSTRYYHGITYTDGNINATAKLSKEESFIPPKSKVSRTTYTLNQVEMYKVPDSLFKKSALNYNDGTGIVHVKEAGFSAANSPLKFRSYLTLYTLKGNQPQMFAYQHEFFVSGMIRTGANPSALTDYAAKPGNVIYNSRTTGFGKAMVGVALVGATGALVATDAALTEKNHK